MVDGTGYTMQIAEGWTAELPENVNRINIEDKDVYRPHCRSAIGTKDLKSADYRTCAFYLDYPCVFLIEFCNKFIWFNATLMILSEGYDEIYLIIRATFLIERYYIICLIELAILF